MNKKTEYGLLLLCTFSLFVSPARSWADEKKPSVMDKGMSSLETYFSIAGSRQFQPLTQRARAVQFRRELLNAFTFVKVVGSAGLDQWAGKQVEWGQGGAGYGKRVANIAGQYAVQKTTMYALSAALRQD